MPDFMLGLVAGIGLSALTAFLVVARRQWQLMKALSRRWRFEVESERGRNR